MLVGLVCGFVLDGEDDEGVLRGKRVLDDRGGRFGASFLGRVLVVGPFVFESSSGLVSSVLGS